MTKIIPAAAVKTGDIIVLFGNKWTVRKITRKDDVISFWFQGVGGKAQLAKPDTEVAVWS